MKSILSPYINFKRNTREAMEFYKSVFGGELTVGTFKDFNVPQEAGDEDLVMHSQLEAANGITFMASDTPDRMEIVAGNNITLTLSGDNEVELTGYFNGLSAGGTITQPLVLANWGDTFGMLIDKFGITWLVNISAAKE